MGSPSITCEAMMADHPFAAPAPSQFLIRLLGSLKQEYPSDRMRFSVQALLLAAIALLAIGSAFALDTQVGRSLRLTETTTAAATDAEARGFPQFVLAHLKNKIKNWRINTWLTLGKTDEQVMAVLGIPQGLTRAELRAHPKFRVFERFEVKKWLKEGASPSKVWGDLGLRNVADNIPSAPGFGTYMEYVWALGAKVAKYNSNGGTAPTIHKVVDPVELEHTVAILKLKGFDDIMIRQIVGALPLF